MTDRPRDLEVVLFEVDEVEVTVPNEVWFDALGLAFLARFADLGSLQGRPREESGTEQFKKFQNPFACLPAHIKADS